MSPIKKIIKFISTIKNFYSYIFELFPHFKINEQVFYLYNNTKYFSRANTSDLAEIVVVNSDYEYPKKYFPNYDNPIILDIGSNIGSFSIYCYHNLKRFNPKIFSIEPSTANFSQLKKNLQLNNIDKKIKIFNLAIFDYDGYGYLDSSGDYDSFSVRSSNTDIKKLQSTLFKTLETFCSENSINKIDLLKIDIEGGEYNVLFKSEVFIKKNVYSIFIEAHDISDTENLITIKEFFFKNNFELIHISGERTLFYINKNISLS